MVRRCPADVRIQSPGVSPSCARREGTAAKVSAVLGKFHIRNPPGLRPGSRNALLNRPAARWRVFRGLRWRELGKRGFATGVKKTEENEGRRGWATPLNTPGAVMFHRTYHST